MLKVLIMNHQQNLAAQQHHARLLGVQRRCPHCGEALSLLDALCIVRGLGFRYFIRIMLPDGSPALMEERDFNPQTMLWADGQSRPRGP